MSEKNNITVNVDSGAKQIMRIIGTIGLCGFVGFIAYALAQNGWLERGATLMTAFLYMFVRLMLNHGLLDMSGLRKKTHHFDNSRNVLTAVWTDFQTWMASTTYLMLGFLASLYAISFLLVREAISVALTVFTNQWVAIACACLIGTLIVSPGLIGQAIKGIKKMRVDESTKE